MATMTTAEAARVLAERDHFAIATHRRPDGDTLGTAALLCRGLRQLGKTAHVLENPETTPKYQFVVEGLTKPREEKGDTIVCVDVASPGMLPVNGKTVTPDLRIDHHGSASSFAKLEWVEPDTAACGEIVFDLLTELGVEMDKNIANAVYTAVATDTGCFRYANTTSHSFATAAACAWISNDIYGINQTLFEFDEVCLGV